MNCGPQFPSQDDYLAILRRFIDYAERGWRIAPDGTPYFGEPSNGENGLRTMGNVVLNYAFLATEALARPEVIQFHRDWLLARARCGIAYMTRSHLTGARRCANGGKWGGNWQSAWWAARLGLGARLIWNHLDASERTGVAEVLRFEADRQTRRRAPSGLFEDTKAEENAWDAEVLATAMSLLPQDRRVNAWRDSLIDFAANVFSAPQDHESTALLDGKPVGERVYTTNVHSDFTLENHGAYHFCYVASSLCSLVWCRYALNSAGLEVPDALDHHFQDVWACCKSTFLDSRFAYMSGKDWARYTYGLYFIVPVLARIQHDYSDTDARAMEHARLACLAQEQADNSDGSFFGKRLTHDRFYGQWAKYETDCYACLALAYLIHEHRKPVSASTRTELATNLAATHVSQECGIAFHRSSRFFTSFSWRSLSTPFPMALFVPTGMDDAAEWQPGNLLGRVYTLRPVRAVSVRTMFRSEVGYFVAGVIGFRTRDGKTLYDLHLRVQVLADQDAVRIQYLYVAKADFRALRTEGLHFCIANDRFNGYRRVYEGTAGVAAVLCPSLEMERRGSLGRAAHSVRRVLNELGLGIVSSRIAGPWVSIDGSLGVVNLRFNSEAYALVQKPWRNVKNGGLHFDTLICPAPRYLPRFRRGETLLAGDFLLTAASTEATKALAEAYRDKRNFLEPIAASGY